MEGLRAYNEKGWITHGRAQKHGSADIHRLTPHSCLLLGCPPHSPSAHMSASIRLPTPPARRTAATFSTYKSRHGKKQDERASKRRKRGESVPRSANLTMHRDALMSSLLGAWSPSRRRRGLNKTRPYPVSCRIKVRKTSSIRARDVPRPSSGIESLRLHNFFSESL